MSQCDLKVYLMNKGNIKKIMHTTQYSESLKVLLTNIYQIAQGLDNCILER